MSFGVHAAASDDQHLAFCAIQFGSNPDLNVWSCHVLCDMYGVHFLLVSAPGTRAKAGNGEVYWYIYCYVGSVLV